LQSSRKLVKQESHVWPDRAETGFPSPRCASAIQIVRLLESIVETQPQLQRLCWDCQRWSHRIEVHSKNIL